MSETASTILIILVAGGCATFIWRALGVIYAGRLEIGSPMLDWVRAVATALIAALIVRMMLDPPGSLADTALVSRTTAIMVGAGAFILLRRSIALGVGCAVVVFLIAEGILVPYFN